MKLFPNVLVIIIGVVLVQAEIRFEIDGNQYFISTPLKKNWNQASRHCYLNGMYLVDMESRDEYTKIVQYLRDHSDEVGKMNFWTAGTSVGSEGDFYWATTGKSFTYDGFPKGQPDNAGGMENCIELSDLFNYEWNDRDCSGINAFICRSTRYVNLLPQLSSPPKTK